jgi:hypothetical protein
MYGQPIKETSVSHVIDDLVLFVNQGAVSPCLEPLVALVDYINFRVVAIELLEWLQHQNRRRSDVPLSLNDRYTWCHDLRAVLSEPGPLSALLEIRGSACVFKDSVPAEERMHCREVASEGYQPPLMSTPFP